MKRVMPVLLLSMAVTAGCTYQHVDPYKQPQRRSSGNSDRVLRVEGSSVILGQAASRPVSANALLDRVDTLLNARDHDAAGELLNRFPEIAREALLDSDLVRHPVAPSVAAWLDQKASPARGGWAMLVDDRSQNPSRYTEYDQQRRSLWIAFRKGDFQTSTTVETHSAAGGPTPWPTIDAAVLKATALLASGKPDRAAVEFEAAAKHAMDWDQAVSERYFLFSALSHRMAGQTTQAEQIELQVESLSPSRLLRINDPMVLRLALKTVGKHPRSSRQNSASPRMIHARLGEVELQRGSEQAALLSFRAAESVLGDRPRTAQLRLSQAEALIALDQEQPAVVMLTGLAKGEARPEALVMLGLIHLKRGDVESAMAMLHEAVRLTSANTHPQIHSDAGLALLSVGQRDQGLQLLRSARQSFKERGEDRAVRQSLVNELRFAESEGDSNLAQKVRGELSASRLTP